MSIDSAQILSHLGTAAKPASDTCFWCGFIHRAKCPLVKAIEYHADGVTVKRVEFFTMQALVAKGEELLP